MLVKKIQFLVKTYLYVGTVIFNDFYRKYIACINILQLYCMSSPSFCIIVLNVGTYSFYSEQASTVLVLNLKNLL